MAKLLGTDIKINEKTRRLEWDSQANDLSVVKGVPNLHQAVKLRLSISPGELIYHPQYGNELLLRVGSRATAVFMALAAGIIHQCIQQDVRIYSVEGVNVTVAGDVCSVDFRARVKNVDLLLQVQSLGLPN